MNQVEERLGQSIRPKLRLVVGLGIASALLLAAGLLRADEGLFDPIPAGISAPRGPVWGSPISPYDPSEGTAAAHAVQIDAGPQSGYVQTSAYAQSVVLPSPAPTPASVYGDPYVSQPTTPAGASGPEQLPPGGYLWGGSPSSPGPAGSYPSAGYTVAGSVPPPESVGPPPAGNLLGGLGFGVSAPIGVPPLGPILSDRPILLMPNLSPDAIHSVFRVHQSITDEVGDDGPITSLGGFFPHTTSRGLWFFDAEFNLLEDAYNPGQQTENFGANVGLGWRWIVPSLDSVAGLSFWYDLDRTRPNFVHQAAVSGEILGDLWQVRLNGYFPAGSNRISTATGLGPAYYVGENIDFGQTRFDNLSMGGMDFEFGRRLPGWLGDNGVSAYIGGYYYRADSAFNTFGVMTRIEALISPNLTFDAKFSNDPLFKNRVGIGFTYLIPNGKCKSCAAESCSEVYRLTEPVIRNRTVVYGTQTVNTPQVALNPATGTPIIVVHVDSTAPAGGNGTVNMPYNNLPSAQTGSAPNDIILVAGGSSFTGQGIALQNSQRFLGEGIPHTVDTVQEGTITLPTTSSSTVLPVIANSPGNTVTLANSNEVSGFTINNSGGEAIYGNGISGTANINNVYINGGVSGIAILNSSAAVTVTNVPIMGAATGITLSNNTGSFDFVGTQTVSGSTVDGVVLTGNSVPATFDNLQLSATTGNGLTATSQTGALTITTGSVTALAGTGVNIDNSAIATAAPLNVMLTSVNAAGGTNGIALNNAGGTFTVGNGSTAGSGGTISNTTGAGISVTGESGTATFNYMTINQPTGDGVDVANTAASGTVTLTDPQIALAGAQTGVNVTGNSGTLNLTTATVGFAAPGAGVGLNVTGSSGTENVSNFTVTNAATGINLATDTGTFNGTGTTTVNGSTVNGVDLTTVSGPTSFGTLNVSATTGTGLLATNQTGTLTVGDGTITASAGTGVDLDNSGIATPAPLAITLTAVNATGGANGIALNNAEGTFTVTGAGAAAGSGGAISDTTGAGVSITGESGTVALNYMNITNPVGNGVDDINAATGSTVTLTGTQIALNAAQTGVNVTGNSGTLNANAVTVNGGAVGLNVSGSSGAENVAGFTVNNAAAGINLATDTGTFNATGTTTVNGSTVNGVDLTGVSGPTSFGTLNIAATTGTGLLATNQTGTLTITGGAITASAGTGVKINNSATTAAPLAVTLTSVNATAGTNGIALNNAGGTFTVTGDGSTAGSGGTISDTTGAGVSITGESGTVALNYMNISMPTGDGVDVATSAAGANVTLTNTAITLAGNQKGINVTNNSGTFNANNATVTGGNAAVVVANSSGNENLANFTATNSATGINFNNDSGTINATGTTTVSGSTANGVTLSNNSAPVSFNNLQVTATTGTGLNVNTQSGLLTISAGTVTADAGTGVLITTGASAGTPLAVTLQSVSSTGGAEGIRLDRAAGTFTVTGSGTTAGSGGTISNSSGDAVRIDDEIGTVALSNMNITSPGGAGVNDENASATANVSVTGFQITNNQQGLNVQQNAGTFAANTTTITGGNTGVQVNSGAGTNNFNSVTVNNATTGVSVQNTSGANNFSGLTVSGGQTGFSATQNSGSINATGTTSITGTTGKAVVFDGNTATATFDNLQIAATAGAGLLVNNQSGLFTVSAGSVSAAGGDAVQIDTGASAGTPLAVTLQSVSATGGANGIELTRAAGTFTVTGTGSTAGSGGTITGTTNDGVQINDEIGTVSLNNMNISNANRNGVNDNAAASTATVNLSNLAIANSNFDGIVATNNAGALNVTNTTSNGANNYGLNLETNTGAVSVSGSTFSNNALDGIYVQNGAGTLGVSGTTLSGNGGVGLGISSSGVTGTFSGLNISGSPTGISLTSNTGALTFNGTTTVTGATTDGVSLSGNSGAISFNDLEVTATNGTGLAVTNQTGMLTISSGNVTADAGTGVSLNNAMQLNVNLGSVNSAGGADGMDLINIAGTFNVSGGTISTTDHGIDIQASSGIGISGMTVSSSAVSTVIVDNSSGVSITGSTLSGNDAYVVDAENNSGTNTFSGNTIVPSDFVYGLYVAQSGSVAATYNLNNNLIISGSIDSQGLVINDSSTGHSTYNINGNNIEMPNSLIGINLTRSGGTYSFVDSTVSNTSISPIPLAVSDNFFIGEIIVNGTTTAF